MEQFTTHINMCQNEGNECQLVDISKIKTKTLPDQPLMSKLAYIKKTSFGNDLYFAFEKRNLFEDILENLHVYLKTCCMCLVQCKCTYLSLWN